MVQFCTGRHTKVPKAMHESTKWCLLVACGLICASLWSRSQCSRLAFEVEEGEIHVDIDWAVNEDFPIFKKYGVMNSGLLDSTRYNKTIFDSLAVVKADALIVDLYMGSANEAAGFRWTVGGFWGAVTDGQNDINGVAFNFTVLDQLAKGLHDAKVWPYWAYTYSPDPFQPKPLSEEQNWAGELSRCPGFEDDPEHYECRPQPQGWSNCWKCPPKDPFGGGYTAYQAVAKVFAAHWKEMQIPVLEEVWNEPDLTEYYDLPTTVSMFIGNSKDYVDMYLAAAKGMLEGDPDTMIGGPGVAYNINNDRSLFPTSQRPNGGDMMVGAAEAGLPVDFFTFHDVNPCLYLPKCNVTDVFVTRADWSRRALTQPEMMDPKQNGRFNTTEIHCTEYHSAVRKVHELLPFTATPALGVMMLNDFKTYLMETDVTKLTWAQYMEVDMHSNGTGLLDYWGNARPSWHTFRFWGDLPIERMNAQSSSGTLNVLSGFDARNCYGSILIWNNDTVDGEATINVTNVPYDSFDVDVFHLDEDHMPGPGFSLEPSSVLKGERAEGGHYTYPGKGKQVTVPVSGILFMNITASSCTAFGNSHLPLPDGVVLKPHHYFGFRPNRTNLYSMFDRRNWAAHLGMGDEPEGWSIAGATVRVRTDEAFNISMTLLDGRLKDSGIWGMRVDYWDELTNSYPPESSLFFYDIKENLTDMIQVPALFGSKQDVLLSNFLPRNLNNFRYTPASSNYRVPSGWQGKLTLLFVLKDGTEYSKVRGYVRSDRSQGSVFRLPQVFDVPTKKSWAFGG